MGYINFSMPKELVKKINEYAPFDNFIETGTYHGGSCFWAAEYISNIYTIEIDAEISKATAKKPDCPKNITFLIGDSRTVLPNLLKSVKGNTLFWLDGHWCPGAGGQESECPIIDEIKVIEELQTSVIFIDDARLFMGPLPKPHNTKHWPRIDEIFSQLKNSFPNHSTTIQDDVIMCFPESISRVIDEDWLERYEQRFMMQINNTKHIKDSLNHKIRNKLKQIFK